MPEINIIYHDCLLIFHFGNGTVSEDVERDHTYLLHKEALIIDGNLKPSTEFSMFNPMFCTHKICEKLIFILFLLP